MASARLDYYGKKESFGNDFTIRVKLPEENRKAWIAQLRRQLAAAARGDILEFTLPIEKSDQPHAQIQICWGKTPSWQDNLYRLSSELDDPTATTESQSTVGSRQ